MLPPALDTLIVTRVRLIAGALYGAHSPVRTLSEMFYADVELDGGARLTVPVRHDERAAYIVADSVALEGDGGTLFAPVPDETEFIPLPESGPVVVRYP